MVACQPATGRSVADVRVEVRGAVKALFRSREDIVMLSGAAGTGKTWGTLMRTHLDALTYPGSRHVLLRKTAVSLAASTLVTWRRAVAAEAIAAGICRFFGGSSQEPAAFKYRNGSEVVVGGLDKASKILSTEYDTAFVDEAVECTADDIETLSTRLRLGVMPYQQLRMCTNPGAPTHHLKAAADAGALQILYSRHEDNPRLFQAGRFTPYGEQYLKRLDALTGVRYQRLRNGLWVAAEGLVFSEWDEAVHLIDRFVPPSEWRRVWTVDFGYTNPTVVQFWAIDPDGRAYLYREYYHSQQTVDQVARAILRKVTDTGTKTGRWLEPKPYAIVCDHDAEGRVVFSREIGLPTRAADKRVKIGIDTALVRLRRAGDGKPRAYFMRDVVMRWDHDLRDRKLPTCTAAEMGSYVWEDKASKEAPVKENDHGCDAFRYLCMFLDPPRRGQSKLLLPTGLGQLR